MTHNAKQLDTSNFDGFVKQGIEVIDFWAEWCGPCKMMGPIFDQAAGVLKGKVKFGKVDVDKNQELAQRFSVMSIPTLIVFKDGEQVDRVSGVISKEELIQRVEKV